MPRPLSVGTRWTLRYAAGVLVLLSLTSVYHYVQVARRLTGDAELVLELQTREVVEAWTRHPADLAELEAYVEQHLDTADPDLRLGIRVFDREPRPVLALGGLAGDRLLPAAGFERGLAKLRFDRIEDGGEYGVLQSLAPAPDGFVQVAISLRPFEREAREIRDIFLVSVPLVLVGSALLGWWLARGTLRPIGDIAETARRISAADLERRIPTSGSGDELDRLAATLNEMIARIAVGMERSRRFAHNAAHQLRTPLNLLENRLDEALTAAREPAADRRVLEASLRDVRRVAEAVRGLLRLAHTEQGLAPEQRAPVRLRALLEEVVEFFEPLANEKDVTLRLAPGPDAIVPGDAGWLHELFANLVDNAIKYTSSKGHVELAVRPEADVVRVDVRDTGDGIEEGEIEAIFESFLRGRLAAGTLGLGLGLPLAREIARAHGGDLLVESRHGLGSTFTVRLPRLAEATKSPA